MTRFELVAQIVSSGLVGPKLSPIERDNLVNNATDIADKIITEDKRLLSMTKPTHGRNLTTIFIEDIHISVGMCGGVTVHNTRPFLLDVVYYYEEYIPATEDEPACEEYLEILGVTTPLPVYFTDKLDCGVALSLTNKADVLALLTDEQYCDLLDKLRANARD